MGKIAFVFPGQASQYPGMGKELAEKYPAARAAFDEADKALGFSISQMCFAGSDEELKQTANTQPAILTCSVAVHRVLAEKGVTPDFVAGHSLGEYSALVASGALKFSDAVQLGEVCSPANLNSPEQTVISGHASAVKRAVEIASQSGAKRAVILAVSAPFHCALMMPAQERLEKDLKSTQFSRLQMPLITNVDADTITTGDEAREALIRQVTMAVRWEESMRLLIEEGVDTFVEVGPGRVLVGLLRQIERSVGALNVEDEKSLSTTMDKIAQSRADAA
jgi:[acyl-carrier-protein] S-malonyltransferase